MMLSLRTAGESHGIGVFVLLEGMPAGLLVDPGFVNAELARRQMGHGRGGRMRIEKDQAQFLSGIYRGKTTGAPILIGVFNRDWENWKGALHPFEFSEERFFFKPRPGHADLPALLKYGYQEMRPCIERSSARETAGRVAGGALCKLLLKEFGIEIASCVVAIGRVKLERELSFDEILKSDASPVRCPDESTSSLMVEEIERAKAQGDSVGGVFEVRAKGVPPGLGSHVQWDERLDAAVAQAMMSIQAVKAVSVGCGWDCAERWGSKFHDEIFWEDGFKRKSNRAGGIEGGISNGEEVVVRCFMKPIPTLSRPLATVDIRTKEAASAGVERSDACAVPAAAVVAEAMLAFVLARAFLKKFGSDNLSDIRKAYDAYIERLRS